MPGPQPSWQPEPCPPWCVREHEESDLPLDRYHQAEPALLPVLVSTDPAEPRDATLTAADLTLRLGAYAAEPVSWIAIEPVADGARLVLSTDSARELARRITELLGDVEG